MVNKDTFKIELFTKIPIERISSMTIEHEVSDKEISAGKAVAGAVIAGGFGAIIGGAMGGKKVSSVLTVNYANANGEICEVVLEAKLASQIKEKYGKYRQSNISQHHSPGTPPQHHIKPRSSSMRRGLFIYFTWPYQLFKKLTNK